jgi:hypothetical protein
VSAGRSHKGSARTFPSEDDDRKIESLFEELRFLPNEQGEDPDPT